MFDRASPSAEGTGDSPPLAATIPIPRARITATGIEALGQDMGTDEDYECDVCGERFESEAALAEHLYSIGIVH